MVIYVLVLEIVLVQLLLACALLYFIIVFLWWNRFEPGAEVLSILGTPVGECRL